MLRTITLTTGLLSFVLCQGQGNITSVTFNPNNISECNMVMITINGNIPGGASPQSFNYLQTGNTVTIPLDVAQGGGPASFSQPVGPFGPYAPGPWVFVIQMVVNGNVVDTETVNKTVTAGVNPNAGTPGEILDVCSEDANFSLFTLLGGGPTPGGTWTNPQNQPHNGTFNPGSDPAGYYLYSLEVLAPCTSAYQTVHVEYVVQTNDPGISGFASTCQGGAPINLFSHLGGTPDAGGTWTNPQNQSHSGTFNPLTDQQGAYTYSLPGTAPCSVVSATVTVTLETPNNAGTGNTVEVCENDSIFALSTGLTGSPMQTGTWKDPGNFTLGNYMVEIIPLLNGPGTYTYIVTSAFCPPDSAFVNLVLLDSTSVDCTVGMEEQMAGLDRFELLPNPTEGIVTVDLGSQSPLDDLRVEVMNAAGAIAYSSNLRSDGQRTLRRELDLSALPAGLYMVRVINGTDSASRRLVLR